MTHDTFSNLISGCNNICWNIFGTLSLYLDLFPTVEWCPVSWIVPRMSARLSSRSSNQILSQRHCVLAPFHYPTTLRQWDNLEKEQLERKEEIKSRLQSIILTKRERCNEIPMGELVKCYNAKKSRKTNRSWKKWTVQEFQRHLEQMQSSRIGWIDRRSKQGLTKNLKQTSRDYLYSSVRITGQRLSLLKPCTFSSSVSFFLFQSSLSAAGSPCRTLVPWQRPGVNRLYPTRAQIWHNESKKRELG